MTLTRTARLSLVGCVLSLPVLTATTSLPALGVPPEGSLERVSSAVDGSAGNLTSRDAVVSGNGRYVAFVSQASDLVEPVVDPPPDPPPAAFFIRDLTTGETSRIDVPDRTFVGGTAGLSYDGRFFVYQTYDAFTPGPPMRGTTLVRYDTTTGNRRVINQTPAGEELPMTSVAGSISRSGRYFAYQSLVRSDDASRGYHLYRWDGRTRETIDFGVVGPLRFGLPGQPVVSADGSRITYSRVTVKNQQAVRTRYFLDVATGDSVEVYPGSTLGAGGSDAHTVSESGRFVLFNQQVGDVPELFVYDARRDTVTQVSQSPVGGSNAAIGQISANGRVIAYRGYGSALVPSADDGNPDVFVYDTRTGETRLASRGPTGAPSLSPSILSGLSGDGETVAFQSESTELVPSDDGIYYDVFAWHP